jgi:hypothetical protein
LSKFSQHFIFDLDWVLSDRTSYKKCCISVKMDGIENEEAAGNAGREHESVGSEYQREDGNCEDTEAETDNRNGEQSVNGEAQ